MVGWALDGEFICKISDEDIIEGFLRPKVNGAATATPRFIVDNMGEELYTREPWLLPQPTDDMLNPREWFYFGKRNPKFCQAQTVRGEGDYCEGMWKPCGGRLRIRSEETGEIIGATTRFRYSFRVKEDKSPMGLTDWFMREYRLCDKIGTPQATLDVVCRLTHNTDELL